MGGVVCIPSPPSTSRDGLQVPDVHSPMSALAPTSNASGGDWNDRTGAGSVGMPFTRGQAPNTASLNIVSWNIAAVNNNPFEYWVTHHDPAYNRLMHDVQLFIDAPGDRDIAVGQIFTHEMWIELKGEMESHGMEGLAEVEKRWEEEYKGRKAISGFMKDKGIGSKRLASMPDRITNTINMSDGSVVMRPTIINGFDGDLGTMERWWDLWKDFVFRFVVQVFNEDGVSPPQVVCKMIEPILHSKYPAITPEEQAISIPLQILCLAIFDSILVHMLNTVAPNTWQPLKRSLCDALISNKSKKNINILSHTYADADVIFIQEAAAAFVDQTMGDDHLARKFSLLKPSVLDGKRDQNSLIFASREIFIEETAVEVTEEVLSLVEGKWAAAGDLVAFRIDGAAGGQKYLLSSFHGDSNGLATLPVMKAIHTVASEQYPDHTLIVGLDANTYREASAQRHGVHQFSEWITSKGMSSCWGEEPDPTNTTTCNARTFLQPQLNKAVRLSDQVSKGEQNLKDWIVFYASQLTASNTNRDNTGRVRYVQEMVYPTLVFPSDHAVVSTTLSPVVKKGAKGGGGNGSDTDSFHVGAMPSPTSARPLSDSRQTSPFALVGRQPRMEGTVASAPLGVDDSTGGTARGSLNPPPGAFTPPSAPVGGPEPPPQPLSLSAMPANS
mmetsp:Transcript_3630/g.8334  ORF Transcript_3630/g.8334 Transcript_3630/m.8334 type:complete len:669 (+) Transcript_3630:248-2254(+)